MSMVNTDLLEWCNGWHRRCKVRLRKSRSGCAWHGRCDLRRGHPGRHALERGMELVTWTERVWVQGWH